MSADIVQLGDRRRPAGERTRWWFTLSVWFVGDYVLGPRPEGALGGRIDNFDPLAGHETASDRLRAYAQALRQAARDLEAQAAAFEAPPP